MNLKSIKYKRATAVAYGSMFFEGGLNAIIISSLVLLSQSLNQDRAAISQLVAIKALGTFLTTFLSGRLSDRLGRKRVIFFGIFFFFAFILGFIFIRDYKLALLFSFIGGLGHGLMDAPAMSILIDAYHGKAGPAMSLVQVFFTGGGVLTSLLASLIISLGWAYQYLFAFFLLIGVLLAILIQITIYPPLVQQTEKKQQTIHYRVKPAFLREGLILGLMTVFYSFNSAIMHTWTPTFALLVKNFSEASSVTVLTCLQIGAVTGATVFAVLLRKLHSTQVLKLAPFLGALAVFGMLTVNSRFLMLICVFALGFVTGNFFSLCINMAGELFPADAGAAVGAVGSLSMISMTLMVSVSGSIFRSAGVNSVMMISVGVLIVLAVFSSLFRYRYLKLGPTSIQKENR